ncbi:MAG: hypothetical protein IJ626_05195 [Muribaculaceae bacterium]|nr:hypothetical protein [Muribaculaceae bacterium]
MNRNLQSILNLLAKTKRQIEIRTADLPFESLWRIAEELNRQDKTMTLAVDSNFTAFQIEQLVNASGDRFNIKFD